MADVLKQANDSGGKLVIVASRGIPAVGKAANDGDQKTINSDLQAIADQIDTLGGTRNGIFDALDPGLSDRTSYTLLGSSKAGPGTAAGEEAVSGGTESGSGVGKSTAAMTGSLTPTGQSYRFEIAAEPVIGAPSSGGGGHPGVGAEELAGVLAQTPSAWPEHGNDGRREAIAWIGHQVFGTGDPRSQYWTVIYKPDTWSGYSSRIGKLAYSRNGNFTAADLTWAKAELQQEIGWLQNTHGYLENLSQPFSRTQLQSWAALQQISNSIRDKIGVTGDEKTNARVAAIWKGSRELLGAIPHVGEAFHAANAIYETVMEFVEIAHEPAENEFQSRADELGSKLADRLVAAQDMLTRQFPNAIAADYAKLKAVGSCTSTDPADWADCPFDHADWQFTQDDQANAAKALIPGVQTWAYGSLLAARYNLYVLPLWWQRNVTKPDQFVGDVFPFTAHPFDGLPDSAQVAKPIYRNLPDYSHQTHRIPPHGLDRDQRWISIGENWQLYALGYLTGEGVIRDRWVMHHPAAEVTNPIFKPVGEGGLAADKETFFDRYFEPKKLAHYPEKDTPTGWCQDHIGAADCK